METESTVILVKTLPSLSYIFICEFCLMEFNNLSSVEMVSSVINPLFKSLPML